MGFQKFSHRLHSDFCRLILRKTEHTCGNTAKGNAFYPIQYRKFQTALITAFQKFAVFFRQSTLYDWTYGVYHIIAGEVISRRDFCRTCGFFMPLCFHDLRTFQPQANPSKGVDTVVDAVVARLITPRHSRICSVHNCTALQCCDVAFPKINIFLNRL